MCEALMKKEAKRRGRFETRFIFFIRFVHSVIAAFLVCSADALLRVL